MRESYKLYAHAYAVLAWPMVLILFMGGVVIDIGIHAGFLGAAYIAALFFLGMQVGSALHTAPKEAEQLMKDAAEAVHREDSDV